MAERHKNNTGIRRNKMTSPSEKVLFDALASLKFLKAEDMSSATRYRCMIFPEVDRTEHDLQSDQSTTATFLDYGANFNFSLDGVDIDLMIEMLEKLVNFQLQGGNLDIFLEMISKYPQEVPKSTLEYSDWHTIYYDQDGNIIREEKEERA